MRRNTLNKLTLISLIAFGVACKPKQVVVTAPQTTAPTGTVAVKDSKSENINTLKSKDLVYNTLSLKGKTNLAVDGKQNDVTLNIRIQKDKTIWVSVTALGGAYEAARAVITPDSLLLLNRANKTITRKPFSYIYEFTNKELNFGLLQSVLSGNTISNFLDASSTLKQENGVWVISGNKGDLSYKNVFNSLMKMNEVTLNDPKASQSLKVNYGEYVKAGDGLFPSTANISSRAGTKQITADIEFTKIEPNVPVEFPFSVPKSFQLIK